MHRLSANFVLGYHGCDQSVADQVLAGNPFRKSDNDYDWLGPGTYFWEANPVAVSNLLVNPCLEEGHQSRGLQSLVPSLI